MQSLQPAAVRSVLCLGAHADDIEIGCGGTLLQLLAERPAVHVTWMVFSAAGERKDEALASANEWLSGAGSATVRLLNYRDSFFPAAWAEIKEEFAALARELSPDLIFTHRRDDAHQDHRVLGELTWCAFRNHTVFEYEVPKYEGDLGQPNVLSPLTPEAAEQKLALLEKHFASQHGKPWYDRETFAALLRLRGLECHSASRYAEGFYARKLCVNIAEIAGRESQMTTAQNEFARAALDSPFSMYTK